MSQGYYDDVALRAQIVGNRRNSSPMFTEAKNKVCKNLIAFVAESALKSFCMLRNVNTSILGPAGPQYRANLKIPIFGAEKN